MHSARWWYLGRKSFPTTWNLDLSFTRTTNDNPFPESRMSCILLPALYIGLFVVPTYNKKEVGPLLDAYSARVSWKWCLPNRLQFSCGCLILESQSCKKELTIDVAKGISLNDKAETTGLMWRPYTLDLIFTSRFIEQLHVRNFVVTPVLSTPSPSWNWFILSIYNHTNNQIRNLNLLFVINSNKLGNK